MTSSDLPQVSQGRISRAAPFIHLRLLGTTDVHSYLLPFDYYSNIEDTPFGLTRAATLIRAARKEAPNSLLFDNGDFLQGTPIGDLTAQRDSGWQEPHPAITSMNLLGYDAGTLGNHEFNFGLDWLRTALSDADFPIVCANAISSSKPNEEPEKTLFPPYKILERALTDSEGITHNLRVGVLGLLPPQITTWDHFHLGDNVRTLDIIEAARATVPLMRADGADIVIALAHTGIDAEDYYPMKENVAIALGTVPGIDAILAGHTHDIFPAPDNDMPEGADNATGTLGGTPAVMPGFRGSHLGVLDLFLQKDSDCWTVAAHRSEARPVSATSDLAPVGADVEICDHLKAAHDHTLQLTNQPLGRTLVPLHSYLAMVRDDPATQLVTRAQRAALIEHLQGTEYAKMPVLSASAPFRTGGRGGPQYFTDVPPGDLRLSNAADLYVFPNTLFGLVLNGAQLRDWLERSAACFNQIAYNVDDQLLCDPDIPGHNFDVVHGLSYQIDLSKPSRYDRAGQLINSTAWRITDLYHKGQPVLDDTRFLMATNSFRAFGGGPYPSLPLSSIVGTTRIPIRELLANYIRKQGTLSPTVEPGWRFAPMRGAEVIYETGPGIRKYPDEIAALGATDLGNTSDGFARLRIPL